MPTGRTGSPFDKLRERSEKQVQRDDPRLPLRQAQGAEVGPILWRAHGAERTRVLI